MAVLWNSVETLSIPVSIVHVMCVHASVIKYLVCLNVCQFDSYQLKLH